jgi:hypothetical protein
MSALPNSAPTPFVVGANFPWIDCGWDFGEPPPGWQRSPARDFGQVERDLSQLRALGITVVRWFLLAGGVNYPVGQRIDSIASPVTNLLGKQVAWELREGKVLPPLSEAFLRDFSSLCRACGNAGLTLLPSFLSFEWFDHAEAQSRGRRSLVMGRAGEHYQLAIERFLDATLTPLLASAQDQRAHIFAWECINEPDWVVRGGPLNIEVKKTVEPWEMDAFIFLATRRIIQAGYRATVGFKQANPSWVQPYLWTYLRSAAARGEYLHQLHHYPTLISDRRLAPAESSDIQAVCVGEFPTSDEQAPLHNYAWADPGLREHDPGEYLFRRLMHIKEQGYAGAFLWDTEPEWIKARRVKNGGELEPDPRVRWTTRQREQVLRFTQSLPSEPVGRV